MEYVDKLIFVGMNMKLADICEINPTAEVLDDNALVSFVAMPDVSEDGRINVGTHRTYGEVKKGYTNFKEGDVLFAKITPCMENGKGALATGLKNRIGFGSTEFHVLRPNSAIVLGQWLYYLTSWSAFRKDAEKHMTGSAGQKRVPKSFLEKYEANVPSIDDQQHQVQQLDRIRKTIDARRQQLSALDDLIKARFVEMFGDPVTNPKQWQMVELGILTDVGSSKRIFEKEYVPEGIPFYRTKEIVELSKGNQISTELFITRERFNEIKRQYGAPKAGDLLISAVGTIGVIWIVDGKNDFYFKDGNLIRVDGSDKFNSVYMKSVLDNLISEYKKQMSSGTAYAALTISGLSKMKVYDVPMALQKEFASFVAQVDKSKAVVQKALDETQLLFDSLMQEYFG